MKFKLFLSTLLALLLLTAVGTSTFPVGTVAEAAPPPRAELLTDIPVEGMLVNGGTFEGLLTVTSFAYDEDTGNLLVSGDLVGTITNPDGTTTEVDDTFTDVVATLGDGTNSLRCSILNLDLGPLDLDVLGLVIELSDIQLDITAVQGPGNLLGNLLCALVGLLDGDGPLSQVIRLLDRINRILG